MLIVILLAITPVFRSQRRRFSLGPPVSLSSPCHQHITTSFSSCLISSSTSFNTTTGPLRSLPTTTTTPCTTTQLPFWWRVRSWEISHSPGLYRPHDGSQCGGESPPPSRLPRPPNHQHQRQHPPNHHHHISKKSNLHPGHLIYLIPRMPKIVTRIQAALVAPHVSPDVPL